MTNGLSELRIGLLQLKKQLDEGTIAPHDHAKLRAASIATFKETIASSSADCDLFGSGFGSSFLEWWRDPAHHTGAQFSYFSNPEDRSVYSSAAAAAPHSSPVPQTGS